MRFLDVDMFRWIDDLRRDASYAVRMQWRSPGFTLLAIVCLTLGIGANVAVFSWIEGILLRPYPLVVDQDRLFAVTGTDRGAPGHTDVSWPDWLDLQRNSTLIEAFIGEKSLQAVRSASPGFSAEGVLTTAVDLFTAGYDPQRARIFQDELIDRLQAIGGVESAAFSRMTPFSYRTYSTAPIAVDGYDAPVDEQPTAEYNEVGPGFLATIGIPLVSGREFTRADNETAALIAIVDETMAAQFWRGVDPVGRRVQVRGRWMQIVGVARNAKYRNLLETPKPFFYVALRQNVSAAAALHIRTTQRPAALAPALVREIHALDANVAPAELITMREQVDRTTAAQRISVTILVVFGTLALVLAAIGLYGVMASTVSQSSRELALRMALGAGASDLLSLVLSRGLVLTAGGIVVGLVAALQLTRLLGYLLYQVSPRDPLAFGAAFLVTAMASLVACVVPAWRAARTDPLHALRG